MIFVTVGTNEARFDRLLTAIGSLEMDEQVVIQHGPSPVRPANAELVDYLTFEEVCEHVRRARVVVTHAGVGSIMVALSNGKRPIAVPRRKAFAEAVDDHQLDFGRQFQAAGLVTLVEVAEELGTAIEAPHELERPLGGTTTLAADLRDYLYRAVPDRTVGFENDSVSGPDDDRPLRSRILSGLAWKAGSQIFVQFARFGVALILARLLTPTEWGLAAMVLVFSGLVVVFTDSALGTALIQRRDLNENDRSTVFWLGVSVGVALTVTGVLLAPLIARFYGEPEVEPLFKVMSLTFVIGALGTTQNALLVRAMRFKALELRLVGATTAGAIAGITIAAAGFGAWAIVIQQLAFSVASTVLVWRATSWRPSWIFSMQTLRNLGHFTANVFGQNLLYQVARNLDNLLIGRYLGPAALGAYGLAYNVMLVPFSRIAAPLQQVFFPAFAQMQTERAAIADIWIRVTRLVGALTVPALVGLVIVAPDFVPVVLGEQWDSAIPVIQILAWAGLLQSLQTLNGEILLALDRSNVLLWFTVVWFCATLGAVVVGLQWGLIGVAACYTVANAVVEPFNAALTARALAVPFTAFLRGLSGVAQATAIMAVAVLTTRALLISDGVSPQVRLLAAVGVGVAVYVPSCAWRAPLVVEEIRRLRRNGSGRPPVFRADSAGTNALPDASAD